MAQKYTPAQWSEAYRLYTEELLTYREVATRTGVAYDRLAQKGADQGWAADQKMARALREDQGRQEARAAQQILDALLTVEDEKTRSQLVYAYERMKRIHAGPATPRIAKREIVEEFLIEFFGWLQERCPLALQALQPVQRQLKGWVEERWV